MERPVRTRQLHLLLFTRKPDDKIIFLKGRSSGSFSVELLPIPYETVAFYSTGEL